MAGETIPSRIWFITAVVGSGLIMAACGGGEPGTVTAPSVSYAQYATQNAALQALWASETATPPATLPGSGQAVYAGILNLDAQVGSATIPLSGTLAMTADFGSSTIAGQAQGFRDASDQAYSGNLNLSNGTIDRGANPAVTDTYFADLTGTLTGGGQSLGISGDLSGDFLGSTAMGTAGIVTGVVTSGFGLGALFGDFTADQ